MLRSTDEVFNHIQAVPAMYDIRMFNRHIITYVHPEVIHESLEVRQIRQPDHLAPRLVCQPLAGRIGERVVQGDAAGQQEAPVAVVNLVPAVTSQHNKTGA